MEIFLCDLFLFFLLIESFGVELDGFRFGKDLFENGDAFLKWESDE